MVHSHSFGSFIPDVALFPEFDAQVILMWIQLLGEDHHHHLVQYCLPVLIFWSHEHCTINIDWYTNNIHSLWEICIVLRCCEYALMISLFMSSLPSNCLLSLLHLPPLPISHRYSALEKWMGHLQSLHHSTIGRVVWGTEQSKHWHLQGPKTKYHYKLHSLIHAAMATSNCLSIGCIIAVLLLQNLTSIKCFYNIIHNCPMV